MVKLQLVKTNLEDSKMMNQKNKILHSLKSYQEYEMDISENEINKHMLAINIVKKIAENVSSYMVYENKNEISIGIGSYVKFIVFTNRISVTQKDVVEEFPVQDLSEDIYDTFHKIHMNEWRLYGIANFSYAKNTFLGNVDVNERLMELFIPNIDIRIQEQKIKIRYMEDFKNIISVVEKCLTDGQSVTRNAKEENSVDVDLIKSMDEDYYKGIVTKAVEDIRNDKYEKVILSRKINLNKNIALLESYLEGRRYNTPARSYCMKMEDLEVVGFSPETVVEVDKNRTVYTFPLAGTRALTDDKVANKKLKEELLKDPKEIAEHAVSVKLAYEELEQVCEKDSVSVIRFMDVLERGTVQHLASRLKGEIKEGLNEWHAFTALFPAVTASGIPKKECIQAIDRLEKDERNLYSGGVITYDKNGTLDVALVLRTAFQNKKETWVRVGAGVVKLSNPERELEETKEKVGSIINKLLYREENL